MCLLLTMCAHCRAVLCCGVSSAGATQQAVWTCLLLNTLTLAMTCSTYFQLCGNGGAREGLQDSSFLHQAVCTNWLAPIATREYPNFSAWMLYGERSNEATLSAAAAATAQQARVASPSPSSSSSSGSSSRSIFDPAFWWGSPPPPPPPPEEPFGLGAFNASHLAELVAPVSSADSGGSVISPVFTMWITLVALYIGATGVAVPDEFCVRALICQAVVCVSATLLAGGLFRACLLWACL